MASDASSFTVFSNNLTSLVRDNPSAFRLTRSVMRVMDRFALRFPSDSDFLETYGDFLVWPKNVLTALRRGYQPDADNEATGFGETGGMDLGFFHETVLSNATNREAAEAHDLLRPFFTKHASHWRAVVRTTVRALERQSSRPRDPAVRTVEMLARLLDLTSAEKALLQHLADQSRCPAADNIDLGFRPRWHGKDEQYVATALGESAVSIRTAMASSGRLFEFGVIESERGFPRFLCVTLTKFYRDLVADDYRSESELIGKVIRPANAASLGIGDFPHLAEDAHAVVRLIQGTKREHAPGVNLLFYGEPGTGKTEFARRVVAESGLKLYEVACEDNDGDPVGSSGRLASLRLALRLLRQHRDCAILFDEVEDVFPAQGVRLFGSFAGASGGNRTSKAWINRLLETNPVPVVWVCNSLDGFDPAYTRRYSYHLEFPVPPRTVRRRILANCTADLVVSANALDRLAADPTLSPGQARIAATAVMLIRPEDGASSEALLERALKGSQRAMGRTLQVQSQVGATHYDLNLLNIECSYSIEKVLDALRRRPRATLCFYGAPGTGKTALAQHIGEALERPLLARKASELLSKWLGQTEQNLAAMFQEAEAENAVLFLDEADSFLRDRSGAQRGWEVTQVNELLQLMESFDGTFICATNLMEIVDEAALRRFSFKLKFLPLTPEQRVKVFAQEVLAGRDEPLLLDLAPAVQALEGLTLGDVAAVRRQETVFGERYAPAQFIEQLQLEVRARRKTGSRPMGFVQ